jgi:hypothetical protein
MQKQAAINLELTQSSSYLLLAASSLIHIYTTPEELFNYSHMPVLPSWSGHIYIYEETTRYIVLVVLCQKIQY